MKMSSQHTFGVLWTSCEAPAARLKRQGFHKKKKKKKKKKKNKNKNNNNKNTQHTTQNTEHRTHNTNTNTNIHTHNTHEAGQILEHQSFPRDLPSASWVESIKAPVREIVRGLIRLPWGTIPP